MADCSKLQGVALAGLAVAQIAIVFLSYRRARETEQSLLNLGKASKQADNELGLHYATLRRLEYEISNANRERTDLEFDVKTNDQHLRTEINRIDKNSLREQKRIEALEVEIARLQSLLEGRRKGEAS